jgi:hypothetical protein
MVIKINFTFLLLLKFDFTILFIIFQTHKIKGVPGLPGVNLWKVKVNGTFSNDLLIPPSIVASMCERVINYTLITSEIFMNSIRVCGNG